MDINSINDSARATSKGTQIVKPGAAMDKNAFLKILSAELTNQDPMQQQDSSAYVAQMAQFSSLEQMSNLNTTFTMSSANSLIGKTVTFNTTDLNGNPYQGIVKSISNKSGSVKLNVQVDDGTTSSVKEFNYEDVADVTNDNSSSMDNLNQNMLLLTASTLIGKQAEFSQLDKNGQNYAGIVKGVQLQDQAVKLSVALNGSQSTVDLPYTALIKVNEV